MQTTKLYVQLYENNIEAGLEKKTIESTPPSPEIPRPLTPPPPLRNFQSLPLGGGYGYFLELRIICSAMCQLITVLATSC